jgi:hypothetical protein
MAAVLRDESTGSGTTTLTATLTGVQTGDLLVACIYERDGNVISGVADDLNGAWGLIFSRAVSVARVAMYFVANSAPGNPLVTATIGGTAPRDMNVSAWSGVPTTATVDTTANTTTSGATAHLHGSITPSAASLLITAAGSTDHGGVVAYDTDFIGLTVDAGANPTRQFYAYKTGHTGIINPTHTVTNSVNSEAGVAAFVETAGAGFDPAVLSWTPRHEVRQGVKTAMVSSGMTPPDRND